MGIIGINIMIYKQTLKRCCKFHFYSSYQIKTGISNYANKLCFCSVDFQLKGGVCAFLRPIKVPRS